MFLSEQSLGAGNKGVGFVKAEYLGLGWVGDRERGFTRGISSERKIFENLVLFLKQMTRDKSRRSGTGCAEGSKPLGRNFDQNRVGGSNREIREKVGQKKTRERVGGSKRAIREREIEGSE